MSRRRSSSGVWVDVIARVLVLMGIMAAPVITWFKDIPKSGQFFLIFFAILAIVAGIGMIVSLSIYRKRLRASAWKKAMANWNNLQQANIVSEKQSARYMTDVELEKFAARVYAKMGYRVKHVGETGDHGIDVYMINPQNKVEVVQCKQWNKPVGEPQVRDLVGAMIHEKAVRGWLWSPQGFSGPAKKWAKGKPIELVDDVEIGRLIEASF